MPDSPSPTDGKRISTAKAAFVDVPWVAYLLLILSTLFWGGNFVLGRAVSSDIPPVALAWWRWSLALLIILPLAWSGIWRLRRVLVDHWRYLLLVSLLGVTIFNTFVYIGLQSLPASNASIMLSSMPVLILALAWLLDGGVLVARQLAGTLISILGVGIVVSEGNPGLLVSNLATGSGNVWVLLAVFSWALYSVLLKKRPAEIGGLVFFAWTALLGWLMLTPFFIYEHMVQGRILIWNQDAVLSIVYFAVFASVMAFLFWNRGVQVLGPSRAGHFIHMIPVWGIILAAVFLGERLVGFHWAGIVTIFSGVILATLGRRQGASGT
jgi:drug/metabolite transporter (DMT)-like permease